MNAYDWAKFQHHVPLGNPLKYQISGIVFYGFLLETYPHFDEGRLKAAYANDDVFVKNMVNNYPQLLHAVVSPETYLNPTETYNANFMYFLVDGDWLLMDDILMIDDEPAPVEIRKDHFGDFQPEIVQPEPEPLPFDGPVQDDEDQLMREYDAQIAQDEVQSLSNPDGPGSWDHSDYIAAVQNEPDPNIETPVYSADELIEAKNTEIIRLMDELAKAQRQLDALVKPLRKVNLAEISPMEGLTLLHEMKRVMKAGE